MDEQQKQNVNQAAEQWTDSTQQVVRTLADRTVALQESNLRLTQNFFHNWIEQVNNQAQGIREATQGLQEQGQRQREAFETLSQEGTNAYSEFLNSAMSFAEHGRAGRPAEPPAGRPGHPAGGAGRGAGDEPGHPAGH